MICAAPPVDAPPVVPLELDGPGEQPVEPALPLEPALVDPAAVELLDDEAAAEPLELDTPPNVDPLVDVEAPLLELEAEPPETFEEPMEVLEVLELAALLSSGDCVQPSPRSRPRARDGQGEAFTR